MSPPIGAGRGTGVALLLQLAGLIVPFVLLFPLATAPPDGNARVVGASMQIRTAVGLLFANCALTIGIAIGVARHLRRHSEVAALWLVVVSGIVFVAQAIDNLQVLSLLSLHQRLEAGSTDEAVRAAVVAVGATRRWAHTTEILVIDWWLFLLYGALGWFRLVPRPLAAFGFLTVLLHFTGIPLRGFLGVAPVGWMGVPMALGHLALGTWLVQRGFSGTGADALG